MKILIVDDEPDVAALTAMGITFHRPDHVVVECTNALEAIARVEDERPDLLLLDLAMPGRDGFSILEELRSSGMELPIIVITARDLEADKVRGLELGADDYITKPFSHKELMARIEAVLRRYRSATAQRRANVLTHGDLQIDYAQRRVSVRGRHVALTPIEYNLLYHLATNAGRVMPHETLLAKVWGAEYRNESHYLKVYVGRLRNKLEADPQSPRYILTVRGVGYQFPAPE
ncbi:MAG TPA: response regulator transcription factor [Candidatus Limnocylindria bacterium]|nr:response regulator transcription factor [Candidatus Limnocylindria bacterium]